MNGTLHTGQVKASVAPTEEQHVVRLVDLRAAFIPRIIELEETSLEIVLTSNSLVENVTVLMENGAAPWECDFTLVIADTDERAFFLRFAAPSSTNPKINLYVGATLLYELTFDGTGKDSKRFEFHYNTEFGFREILAQQS